MQSPPCRVKLARPRNGCAGLFLRRGRGDSTHIGGGTCDAMMADSVIGGDQLTTVMIFAAF